MPKKLRHFALPAIKMLIGCALLAFLVYQAQQHEGLSRLVDQPKNWPLLALGVVLIFIAIALSFVRWWFLTRALNVQATLSDTMRIGSIGFALNFVAPGNVGGDLFKAILLAREQHGRRTEAVASVIIDRVMGLISMLVLASIAILCLGALSGELPQAVIVLCRTVLLVTSIAVVGLIALASSERWAWWTARMLGQLPLVGNLAMRAIGALLALRRSPQLVCSAIALCFVVDAIFILSVYVISQGLPVTAPSAAAHFLIVPVSSIAGALPLTPNGLGTTEAAMESLYLGFSSAVQGDGTIVALAHRLAMMVVGALALVYYFTRRAELKPLLDHAEEQAFE